MTLREYLTSIADTIRSFKTNDNDKKIKATEFNNEITNVVSERESIGWEYGYVNGYSEGYGIGNADGKESMIDRSKVIEKTANGNPAVIDDASEIPHTVGVAVLNNKNLINIDAMCNAVLVKNADGSYTITKIDNSSRFSYSTNITIPSQTAITFSCKPIDDNSVSGLFAQILFADNTYGYPKVESNSSYTYNKDIVSISLYMQSSENDGAYITFKDFQVEIGTTATDYVPYNSPAVGVKVVKYGDSLIKTPYQDGTTTINGITFTQFDNCVVANGTATADTTYVIKNLPLLGKYILNGSPSGSSTNTYFMGLGTSDYADIGNGVVRSYDTEMAQNIFIRIKSGITVNNIRFTPILEKDVSVKQTYTTDSNGCFECDSLSPDMTFVCDDVVDITVNYWKSWGMQTEYDRFWDAYQLPKQNKAYNYAFAYWAGECFKPKYDILPAAVSSMFLNFNQWSEAPLDLVDVLNKQGVKLDTSGMMGVSSYVFAGANVSTIPLLDLTNGATMIGTFEGCKAEVIEGLILPVDMSKQQFSTTFSRCSNLKEIRITNTFGQDISFADSPLLTTESLRSILTALSKDDLVGNGKTLTLNSESRAVIEADQECISMLGMAVGAAGWTVAYI